MKVLTIGNVAQRAGLHTSALRYYESIGLIPAAARVSGQRRYTEEVMSRLRMIRAAQEVGFSLDDIKTLLDGFTPDTLPSERWRDMAQSKLPEVDALIARATAMKQLLEAGLNCQCIRIEDCFESAPGVTVRTCADPT